MMNQCIHGVDLLRWMMGDEVESVYAQTAQQFHDYLKAFAHQRPVRPEKTKA